MYELTQSKSLINNPFDDTLARELLRSANETMLRDSGNQVFAKMQKELQELR